MNFEQWCNEMRIQGKWKTKLRKALDEEGYDVKEVDETVFAPTWDRIIKPKPAVSKYAISERLRISRQAVCQWKDFDNSDKNEVAQYLRARAEKTRKRGLSALELSKELGEAAEYYLTTELNGLLSPKDVAKRVSRTAQYVVKWEIKLYPIEVAARCHLLQHHNLDVGQAYIDRANGMIAIAREIEEGLW